MSCFLGLGQLVTQKINIRYLAHRSPKVRFIVKAIFRTKTEKKWSFLIGLIWGRIQNWETAPFHIILYGLDEFIYFCFFFLYHFFCILYLFFSYKNNFSKQEALENSLDVLTKSIHKLLNPTKQSWKQSETSYCIAYFILFK